MPASQILVLAASEPTSGDGVAVAEAAFATDERRDRDLALLPVGPEVLDLVPAPGSVDVPLGIEPVVTFTEAIDPASAPGEIELWVDGSPWPVDLAVEGSLVRLLPRASLPAATEVNLRVGLGVRDLQGHPTPNPVSATFTTAADSGSTEVDRRRIRLIAPDASGQVQVLGLPGAVPAGSTVFVENQTSFSTTETVIAAQDGSFALSLAASLTDRLLLRAVLPDGADVFLVLGPFLSADQRSALVGSEAVTFTTGDGVTVYVPAEAVVSPGWIRLALEPTQRPVEVPTDLTALFDLAVDLGEVELRQPLEVELPAPDGLTGGPLLLMRSHEAFGRRGWMLHDLMRTEDSVLTTSAVGTLAALPSSKALTQGVTASKSGVVFPDAGTPRLLQPEQMEALSRRRSGSVRVLPAVPRRPARSAAVVSQRSVAGLDVKRGAIPSDLKNIGDVEALLQGVSHSGHYVGVESQVPLAYVQVPVGSGLNVVAFSDTFGAVPMMADSSIVLAGQSITRLVLPSRLGESYTLEVRNLRSGYELFNQLMEPPSEEFVELSPTLLRDDDAPVVVDGSPLGFHLLQTFADGTWSVASGVTLTVVGSSATLTGDVGAVDPEAAVRVVAIDGVGTSATTVASIQGSFSLQFNTGSGARHLLGLGGAVRSSSALELSFSEALGDDLSALKVERQRAGTNVWDGVALDKTPVGSREVIRLQPSHGWQPGDYRLVVGAGLPDRMVPPNTTTWSLTLPFTVEGVTSIGGGVDVGPVRDLARLGSLLFVAGNNGVGIYDVSDPRQPQPYLPGNLQMPFPNQDAVRGLAVDAHGRVLAVGGGTQTFGQLRMLDVTALDRAAIASDPDARLAGWRGTSLVTEIGNNDTVPQLVSGTPRRVAVLPNEGVLAFALDDELPGGLAYTPSTPATGELAYRATLGSASLFAGPNQAVTLHNRSRGTWHRLDADGSGAFEFTLRVEPHPLAQSDALGAGTEPHLTVAPGERLELAIDKGGLAYVTVDGAGMAVVDLGSVYGESISTPNHPALSDVLAYVPPFQVDTSVPCDIGSPLVSGQPTDVGVLVDPDNAEPLVVPVLLERYGVALYRAIDPQSPADLVALGQICGAVDGTARLTSMEVVQGYPLAVDTDGDGVVEDATPRDLILATHGAGHVLAFDVTDRAAPVRLGRVQLPGSAAALSVDRTNRTLLVAGAAGLAVVRLDDVWGELGVDVDQDGQDDRVVEWVTLGSEATGILASAELGLAWLGSNDVDADGVTLRGLSLSAPEVNLVSAAPGIPQAVSRVAPLGVPTASPGGVTLPAWVRLQAVIPPAVAGSLGSGYLPFDLVSQGPGGLEIDGLSPLDGVTLPSTSLRGLALKRQGRHPWEQGYGLFLSDPVVLLADLRAMADYERTALEDAVCRRCDVHAEGIYPGGALPGAANRWPELLSGHQLAARWPADLRVALSEIYTGAMLDAAEVSVDSVPWDLSPTPRQEPTLNPSMGTGDVAPGTLLHSGEFSHQVTDVAVPGRGGLDLAFTRTYRSQSLSDGPLGPGWDHAFRARLRPLPNGDVDFFDGRGRRETFEALPAGQFRPPAGRFVWLKRTAQGWQMQDAGGTNLLFDRWGRLIAIFDPFNDQENEGTRLSLTYDSASRLTGVSTHGRYLAFTYSDEGRITEIADHSGRIFRLGYDAEGRLTDSTTPAVLTGQSQFPDGITTVCGYEPFGLDDDTVAEYLNRRDNMTVLSQPYDASDVASRVDWLEVGYSHLGDTGHFVTQQTWGGDALSIVYDFAARTAVVKDRRQNDATYTHTPEGHLNTFLDRAGHTTTWNYGVYPELEHGLVREVILANGRSTRYEYTQESEPAAGRRFRELANVARMVVTGAGAESPNGVLPLHVPESFTTELTSYETVTNQPLRTVDPEGRVVESSVDEDGFPFESRQPLEAPGGTSIPDQVSTTARQRTPFGETLREQLTIVDGEDAVVEYQYFDSGPRAGFLESTVLDPDGLALKTLYKTDLRGNVIEQTDPRGVVHEFVYNEVDWLVEERYATRTNAPGLPPIDYRIRYQHDARGNVVEIERGSGVPGSGTSTSLGFEYGVLDEVLESWRQIEGETKAITTTVYDPNRNPIEVRGPVGELATVAYDPRNLPEERLAYRSTDGSASFEVVPERLSYDEVGLLRERIVGEHDPSSGVVGRVWKIDYDGYGRPFRQTDPETHFVDSFFDGSSNLVRQEAYGFVTGQPVAQLLARTEFVHDGGSRPVVTRRWLRSASGEESEIVESSIIDEAGLLRQTTDGRGRRIVYSYDSAQRMRGFFDIEQGFGIDYSLDAAGNRIQEIERVLGAPTDGQIQRSMAYDALNRVIEQTDGEGNTWSSVLDVRGNVLRSEEPSGDFTTAEYDGLDRLISRTRPEGITEAWTYDLSSRLEAYEDSRGQTTQWTYSLLAEPLTLTYPDGRVESYEYNDKGDAVRITQPTGTLINQAFDPLGRVAGRTIQHGPGVTGVDLEIFNYDGLRRLTETSSRVGSDLERSLFSYDTLSRVVGTSQLSQVVGAQPHLNLGQTHGYDASHNRIETTRHSGFGIARSFDSHDRLVSVNDGTGTAPDWAGYDYAGMGAVAERQVSGFVGQMTVDGVGRPTRRIYAGIHDEVLGWSSRNLLESHQRLDLAGAMQTHTYDDAGRLLASQWEDGAGASLEWSPLGGETSFGFSYDAAENLVQGTRGNACGSQQAAFTIGDRNRPTAVDGKVIEWDANGNLTRKGNRLYSYDYRGRLVKVEEEPSAGSPVEVVRYTYDASNRRVGRQVPGSDAVQTVWDGWRPVEEYRVGSDGSTQLIARRTYGAGLDEIVLLEAETEAGWSSAIPFYDVTGNLVQLVATDGTVVERYEYAPYGDRRVLGEGSAPEVAQLRWESNQLVIEVSERIDPEALAAAINEERLTLVNDTQGGVLVPLEAGMVTTTCLATGRVFALAMIEPEAGNPDPRPVAGDTVTLSIPADALQGMFGTPSLAPYSLTSVWSSGDMVLDDQASPHLVEATVSADGFLDVELSEIVDGSTLSAITLGGQPLTWTAQDDGRRFQSTTAVGGGSQTFAVSTALLDLAGTSLVAPVSETFERNIGSVQVVSTSLPQWGEESSQGNPFGFKGLEWDADAELYYVRNRYYDPELGRFITPDPLGYVDGPSMYQFGLNDPVNGSDPLGLYAGSGEERRQVREWLAAEEARLQQHRNQQKHRHEMVYLATTNPNHDPREVMFRYFQARGYTTVGAAEAVGGLLGPRGMSARTAEGQFYDALAYQLANKGQILDATLELTMAVGSVFGATGGVGGLVRARGDVARLWPGSDFNATGGLLLRRIPETGGDDLLSQRALKRLRSFLAKRDVALRILPEEELTKMRSSAAFGVGRRDPNRAVLFVKPRPNRYEVLHELGHFIQWRRLGGPAYKQLSRFEHEKFVHDLLRKPSRWRRLTPRQRQHADDYIETERLIDSLKRGDWINGN